MKNKPVIKVDVWEMWKILIQADESYLFAKYLTKPKTESERIYVNTNAHFRFIRDSMWKICLIELYKLYSSDYYSINKLNSRIRKKFYNINIDVKVLDTISGEVKKNRQVIERLLKIRNKRLAHSDPGEFTIDELTIKEVESLIDSTKAVIFSVYTTYLDSHPIFESIVFKSRPFNYINKLIEADRKYEESILESFKNRGKNIV